MRTLCSPLCNLFGKPRSICWKLSQTATVSSPTRRNLLSRPTLSHFSRCSALPENLDTWKSVQKWLVFSDLHVSTATIDVCLEVLATVRQEANDRGAGVVFLGDFWHHRGSLPVEPLNAVLKELGDWRFPTLMLVGNHDQVTAGGLVHALTPIAACNPNIHVFSRPAEFLGALWLPYRRDPQELRDAVAAAGDIKAVFAHVDVVGAHVNESFQAREGVRPELFPGGVPTYTGHYHRRHTVAGTNIHYVGSPFQVSRSEAGQVKALSVLDADWRHVDAIRLDLGPRFFVASAADPPQRVRRGDRVRLLLDGQTPSPSEESLMRELKEQGTSVEVVSPLAAAPPRIAAAEALFQRFAESASLSEGAVAAGHAILKKLEGGGTRLAARSIRLDLHNLELRGFGPFADPVTYRLGGRGVRVVVGSNLEESGADSNGAGKTALVMAPLWVLCGRLDGAPRGTTHSDVVSDSCKTAFGRVEGTVNGRPFAVERAVTRRSLSKLWFSLDGEDCTQADSRMTQARIDEELGTALLSCAVFLNQGGVTALLEASDGDFKEELGKVVDTGIWEKAKELAATELKRRRSDASRLSGQLESAAEQVGRLVRQCNASRENSAAWVEEHSLRVAHVLQRVHIAERAVGDAVSEALALCEELHDAAHAVAASGPDKRARKKAQAGGSAGRQEDRKARERARRSRELRVELDEEAARQEELEQQAEVLDQKYHQLQSELWAEKETLAGFIASERVARTALESYHSLSLLSLADGSPGGGNGSAPGSLVCDRCNQPIDRDVFERNLSRLQGDLDVAVAAAAAAKQRAAAAKSAADGAAAELQDTRSALEEGLARRSELAQALEELERSQAEELREALSRERAQLERESQAAVVKEFLRRSTAEIELALGSLTFVPPTGSKDGLCSFDDGFSEALRIGEERMQELDLRCRDFAACQQEAAVVRAAGNPYSMEVERLEELLGESRADLSAREAEARAVAEQVKDLEAVDKAFGRAGIPSFVLEGALAELQGLTAGFLETISGAFSLSISPVKTGGGRGKAKEAEHITKTVRVRLRNGDVVERSFRQLSGGERRRLALALSLGFVRLSAARGVFECNLLVLDEVLQHLDNEGCSSVAAVLGGLPQGTVLLVGQDGTFVTESFDLIDVVVKEDGRSRVEERSS
uniref:Calcineurin-like phosphoesterase domain-containing protein n=1 Tax=Tetraselmis sp. GSL018 TaxID=582737 RepID=A0A061SMF6_9CHLO